MKYSFLVLLSFCFSCGCEIVDSEKEKLRQKDISLVLDNICSLEKSEFSELYDGNIRYVSYDSFNSVLLDSLKLKGFEVINIGWGNWEFGPRIMSFTAKKGSCQCLVAKRYWADEAEARKITETIECSVK